MKTPKERWARVLKLTLGFGGFALVLGTVAAWNNNRHEPLDLLLIALGWFGIVGGTVFVLSAVAIHGDAWLKNHIARLR